MIQSESVLFTLPALTFLILSACGQSSSPTTQQTDPQIQTSVEHADVLIWINQQDSTWKTKYQPGIQKASVMQAQLVEAEAANCGLPFPTPSGRWYQICVEGYFNYYVRRFYWW
ncbi:hypothetical protein [Deinococcus frigens]|uniref:hypothetical protein n=1 Tax=Deinococcus frigens TaxID=249403 RepID=UPI0012EC1A66|nr:hypothetical protein [Deinococcus frigens]